MGLYRVHVLPRIVHWTLRRDRFSSVREPYLRSVAGEVLEVGFGSGLNLPYYPPAVTRLWAVDPTGVGWRLAARARARAPFPVERVGLDGQALPLPSGTVDGVVSTWSLCTIPDPLQALAEIRRVLRPGGRFHFVEHGLAPHPRVARWQRRLNPLQKRFAGGCHLDRPIADLLTTAGFHPTRLDRFYLDAPRFIGYTYAGEAVPR